MGVNLTVPTVRLGPIAFDGLKTLPGVDLADVLSSLMIGPKFQRAGGGGIVAVYPLAIPEGEGLSIPIRPFGEIGFYNLHSVLVVPVAAIDVVTAHLAAEISVGEAAGPRIRPGLSGGTVSEYAVTLKAGMRKPVPLGTFGEFGVEAG